MAKRRKTSGGSVSPKSKPARRDPSTASLKKTNLQSKLAADRLAGAKASPLERAEELASRAFDSPDPDRAVALARKALALSADCADAYVVLSRYVHDGRKSRELLEEGLAAAERTLGTEVLTNSVGHFWGIAETRPYMRARLALAECLWAIGCQSEAVEHEFALLRLNPNDNQAVRYLLASHLLELGRDEDFDRLVKEYDDATAFISFSRALREFRRSGDSPEARKLLAQARARNRFVVGELLHGTRSPELPAGFSPGGSDEAGLYLADFGGAWKQTPGAITWLRQVVDGLTRKPRKGVVGPAATVKKQLEKLPQSYGTIWQAAVGRVPTWLRDGELMVRPWSILIVNHSEHLIVGQELVTEQPIAELVFDHLARAMRKPLAGKSHRPSEIQVRDEPLWTVLQPHVEEIGIDCIFRAELEEADFILGEMHKLMQPEGQPPALAEAATFTSAQGASLYEAAAGYFRQTPWRKLPSSGVMQVDCLQLREFGPGRWYAVPMGQAGQTLGLGVYDDLATLAMHSGECCADEPAAGALTMSVIFGENFEIPIVDLIAAEQHHWPVASPEAYPLVLCTEGAVPDVRPLEPWQLQLLEGCLRTVPEFLAKHPFADGPASATLGPVGPANLKLTLSWAEPGWGECDDACESCEN